MSGSSLLDNSMVLFGSDLKDGNGHVTKEWPIVLAGRGEGRLEPRRRIQHRKGTPLVNLHLSLLRRMGVETDRFHTSTDNLSDLG